MRFIVRLIILAIVIAGAYYLFITFIKPFFLPSVKVVHMIDGDTLVVQENRKLYYVQLIGVDAPEESGIEKKPQCFGYEAKHLAAKYFLKNQDVRLERDAELGDLDIHKRSLRYVFLNNGTLLNEMMLQQGLARQYIDPKKNYQYEQRFKNAQEKAIREQKGFWNPENGCEGSF